tara:strand:- start:4970 stop:5905 length:936 start_codon:yes stop_codon:yes gene_type:complete
MKLNDLQSKYESRIERVSRWLDETYGFKVYDNVSLAELYKAKVDLDAQRESLKRSLPFNTYHENPQYAKNLLLSEAVVLMISHIDDKDIPSANSNDAGQDSPVGSTETTEAAKPDFLDLDKDGNKTEPMKKAVSDKEKTNEELTAAQKKLPAGLQKAIAKKQGDKEEVTEDTAELEQAQTVLASQQMPEEVQSMIEKVSKMQNEDLAAIVDQMANEFGMDQAVAFRDSVSASLDNLLQVAKETKDAVNNEVLKLQGEAPASSNMSDETPDLEDELGGDLEDEIKSDSDASTDGDDSASGPADEPLGRARKE